jgi:hypothetical protein
MKHELTEAEKKIEYDLKLELKESIKYINSLSDNEVDRDHSILSGEEYNPVKNNHITLKIKKLWDVIDNYKKFNYDYYFLLALLSDMEYDERTLQLDVYAKEVKRINEKYEDYTDIHTYILKYKDIFKQRKEAMKLKGFVFSD